MLRDATSGTRSRADYSAVMARYLPLMANVLALQTRTIDELTIDDERSFRHVGLYADLKEVLRRDGYKVRILPESLSGRWDRALFLNLTFWGAGEGGDVLQESQIPADVVAHAAWHHLAARAFGVAVDVARPHSSPSSESAAVQVARPHSSPSSESGGALSADALFLGEAIASAFDVYLVGRLLGHAPESSFLETQVPAMAEAAQAAGLSDQGFEALLAGIARDPEGAFEDLRALLVDVTRALVVCTSADDALAALAPFDARRFGPLLHRYELSNWVLYARAYAGAALGPDPRVRLVDSALRAEGVVAIDWLTEKWVMPALSRA
jgi:hypothetical protein